VCPPPVLSSPEHTATKEEEEETVEAVEEEEEGEEAVAWLGARAVSAVSDSSRAALARVGIPRAHS